MFGLFALLLFATDDPAFGGAEIVEDAADDACVIRGDDGVWRTCAEALAAKKKTEPENEGPAPVDPEQEKLREAFNRAPEVPKKTKLELDYEKAGLDVAQPLLALRISVARLEQELKELEDRSAAPSRTAPVAQALAKEKLALDIIEGIGLARLVDCTKRIGKPIVIKNYRMTAGGPVYLAPQEVMAQVPSTDPFGCGRIEMIDRGTVERARRLSEVRTTLDGTNFGYHDVGKRKELERELRALEDDLEAQSMPGLGPKTKKRKAR